MKHDKPENFAEASENLREATAELGNAIREEWERLTLKGRIFRISLAFAAAFAFAILIEAARQ